MSEIVPARVATESNGAFCIGCSNATNGQIPWQVLLSLARGLCEDHLLRICHIPTIFPEIAPLNDH